MTRVARGLPTALLAATAICAAFLGACSRDERASPAPPVQAPTMTATAESAWTECQASDQAWIRRAILALAGRRPWGQAEINVYEDMLRAVDALELDPAHTSTELAAAGQLSPGRKLVARALMADDDFRLRWSDFLMDALHVVRIEDKSLQDCYGSPSARPLDDGSLAAWVRDHGAANSQPPTPGFTMRDLLSSALVLDDISVVYRGHLFAMVSHPIHGANLDAVALERARRQDFGGVFDAAYLHRNLVCLTCHNSEYSTTYDSDPAKNRAWPLPGLVEQALFGASSGAHPEAEAATKGSDALRGHSMLRYDGVAGGPDGAPPYGWDATRCGAFAHPTGDPLLGIDTYFGNLRGDRSSVWDLEASLQRGVDRLAGNGLSVLPGGAVHDPDEAFAFVVAENFVEQVWAEIMGTRLTIANDFPRNQVQRDVLEQLTDGFAKSHFSLQTLLLQIVAHPAFNLLPPSAGCGASAYDLPNLFDPWTTENSDPSLRGNGGGDAVFAISARPLTRALHRAMEWPSVEDYPSDATFQSAVGFFIKDAEPGFRGLDFQGRITWESVYGACAARPDDFVTRVVATASTTAGATLGDGVIALKDRLFGEPSIDPGAEQPLLEALVGDALDRPTPALPATDLDGKLRRACGVFVSSPQFMLGGTVPEDARAVPKLTPIEHGYAATCAAVAPTAAKLGLTMTCGPDSAKFGTER